MELENVKQEELQLELEHHKKSNLRTSNKFIDMALNSPAESTTSSGDLSKLMIIFLCINNSSDFDVCV